MRAVFADTRAVSFESRCALEEEVRGALAEELRGALPEELRGALAEARVVFAEGFVLAEEVVFAETRRDSACGLFLPDFGLELEEALLETVLFFEPLLDLALRDGLELRDEVPRPAEPLADVARLADAEGRREAEEPREVLEPDEAEAAAPDLALSEFFFAVEGFDLVFDERL